MKVARLLIKRLLKQLSNRKATIPANVHNVYNGMWIPLPYISKPVGYSFISAIVTNTLHFSKTSLPNSLQRTHVDSAFHFIQELREQALDDDDEQDGDLYAGSNDDGEGVGIEMTGVDMMTGMEILTISADVGGVVDRSEDLLMKLA